MNPMRHRQLTDEAVKGKFRGNQTLHCKTTPLYPLSAEREYQKITDQYMKIYHGVLKEHLPKIQEAYQKEWAGLDKTQRADGKTEFWGVLTAIFLQMGIALEKKLSIFRIHDKVSTMANMTRKLTIKEWKKSVQSTLGVDIMEDYYRGDFYKTQTDLWIEDNVSLIKSITDQDLGQMEILVKDAFSQGKPVPTLAKEIQEQYGVSKSKARLLARDQLGKLHCDITKQQQLDAGVGEYIWADGRDERVRDSHRELNGKKFSWDDPPIVDKKTGRRCHPGQDYQCRCIARPVFNRRKLELPLTGADDKK